MDTATRSPSRYADMVTVLERIWQRRQGSPLDSPSDHLYYKLLLNYNRRILAAHGEGKRLIAAGIYVPNEIIYALDLVPLHLENVPVTYGILMGEGSDLLATAKSFGLAPEICSNHRTIAGFFLRRLAPPVDAVVWTHLLCDNTAKIGGLLTKLCGVPGFFLDRPYRANGAGLAYLVNQLEDLIAFLERIAGRRLDAGRLEASFNYSRQMVHLSSELDKLRMRSPSPISSRKIYQLLFISWLYGGCAEAVEFYQTVLNEASTPGRIAPEERTRILSLFVAPNYAWKLLDWLEREHGARFVADPYHCHWGGWSYESVDPLSSLARKMLATPACRQLHGPVDNFIQDCLEDAHDYRARAAIYWAHLGCRQACGAIRLVKDRLKEAGIPTLVLDCDISDPSVIGLDEIKEKIDGFFETIGEAGA